MFWLYATLKTRGKLGRVNFRKDFWDCYWRVPSNDPRNHCGTCFGSSSLLVLILLISSSVYTIVFATLKIRGKLGRVNFRKDVWDWYWRVPSNNPRNNCGTHFGSSSLLVSIVLISSSVYTIVFVVKNERETGLSVLWQRRLGLLLARAQLRPKNNCGTHFGSCSLLVSKVPISCSVYTIDPGSDMKRLFCCKSLLLCG